MVFNMDNINNFISTSITYIEANLKELIFYKEKDVVFSFFCFYSIIISIKKW